MRGLNTGREGKAKGKMGEHRMGKFKEVVEVSPLQRIDGIFIED